MATVKLWTDDEVAAVPAVKAVFDEKQIQSSGGVAVGAASGMVSAR